MAVLPNILSKREYYLWISYFRNKKPDETEIQLATIGLIVSRGLGNKDAEFKDFLVNEMGKNVSSGTKLTEKIEGTEHQVMTSDAVRSIFGGMTTKKE